MYSIVTSTHLDQTLQSEGQSDEKGSQDTFWLRKSGGRVLRARRYKRQFEEERPVKRLFTPEIKRYLKSWLVRRRDNPYPSREEKKDLAYQTGLTYIQICNWFANWRRKLKNTGKETDSTTWSTLIKTYNGHVDGHVEQFSISSGDSIWHESETLVMKKNSQKTTQAMRPADHSYTTPVNQCFQITSTTDFSKRSDGRKSPFDSNGNYSCQQKQVFASVEPSTPLLLSRWLQSASHFKPRPDSYIPQTNFRINTSRLYEDILSSMHGREEMAAAVALTALSRASRT